MRKKTFLCYRQNPIEKRKKKMGSLTQACSSSSSLAKSVFSLASSSPFFFTSGHTKITRHYSSSFFRASTSPLASVCVDSKEVRSTDLVDLEYAELNLKYKISEVSSFHLSLSSLSLCSFLLLTFLFCRKWVM